MEVKLKFLLSCLIQQVCVCVGGGVPGIEKNNKIHICISTTLLEANSPWSCHISACFLFPTTFA